MQTIRYLSRSKLLGTSRTVELISDRAQYYRGESVPLHVRFFDERMAPVADDGVVVVVEQERGRRQRIKLHRDLMRRGIFEGTVSNLAEGSYRAWIAAPTVEDNPPADDFVVVPPPGERARLAMDATDLRLAAKTSQGRFYEHQVGGPVAGRIAARETGPDRVAALDARLEFAASGRPVCVPLDRRMAHPPQTRMDVRHLWPRSPDVVVICSLGRRGLMDARCGAPKRTCVQRIVALRADAR